MTALLFWLRYLFRVIANMVTPFRPGVRDRLCCWEKEFPWRPETSLAEFVESAIEEHGLENEAGEIRGFLDFWLPRQVLSGINKVLIEFSMATGTPGFGMMLYGTRQVENEAFAEYCRQGSVASRGVELCTAIVNTFSASSLAMVRAEYKPGEEPRYSIAGSWHFDVFRGHLGFVKNMARLPEKAPGKALAAGVAAITEDMGKEFYPLFFGLSFQDAGRLEAKMYWVRFDPKESPLRPGSSLWRLLEGLGLAAEGMERVKDCNDLLWAGSCDGMTQIAVEFSEGETKPNRVNLIYSGTELAAVHGVLEKLGLTNGERESVEQFEKMMKTSRAKFVAVRIGPSGISPRVKLYGHALFDTRGWKSGDMVLQEEDAQVALSGKA